MQRWLGREKEKKEGGSGKFQELLEADLSTS
jgi:hypothetical protein